jgi:murein L,D-transpeptidase YcbB/YkuD
MKKLIFALAISIAFASCNYFDKSRADNSSGKVPQTSEAPEAPQARDVTITLANAYNDMFIDSTSVDNFIRSKNILAADAQSVKNFYNPRNYGYAWFFKDGLTEQGRAFWNAYTYANMHGQKDPSPNKQLNKKMDSLLDAETVMIEGNDTAFANIEMALTLKFLDYKRNSDKQSLINKVPSTWLVPTKKTDVVAMADSILNNKEIGAVSDTVNKPFTALKAQLGKYDSIAKKGGWRPIIARVGKLKKGVSSPIIAAIKKRLQITGEMEGSDTSRKYNDTLELAIKNYQQRNGFKADGLITDSLVTNMNIPVQQRLKQLLVNINRMLWIPPQVKDNYVQVNIPDFMLTVYEGNSKAFDMPVVVGKEGSGTMMFTGDINQIVFSPYWNVPASIVRDEILPAMQDDPNYLKTKRMEIVRKSDSLPVIRQLPGPGNALGRVKFMFPNSYDIYLHDTEAKDIFENKQRAFSHGCIRLADAEKMAKYVLRDQKEWTPEKISSAMNSTKPVEVAVKNKIPVVITYFTTYVDDERQLVFREDIYGHDKRMADRMFISSSAPAT